MSRPPEPPYRPEGWGERNVLNGALQDLLRVGALARPEIGRRLGLSLTETWALEHLATEPLGPVELSRRLGVTSAAATVLVHRMEAAGHLSREPHPADRRRTVLRPTPEALRRLFGELGPLVRALDEAGDHLDVRDRDVVAGYLRAVTAVLADYVGEDDG